MYKIVKDSDGVEHYVYKQDEAVSCWLAAMFMIDNEISLRTHREGEPRLRNFSGKPKGGGSRENIDSIARAIGLRWTEKASFDYRINDYEFKKSMITDGRPALVIVEKKKWFGLLTEVGHAVVATRVSRKGQIVLADPWDASLVEFQIKGGVYRFDTRVMEIWYTG